MWIKISVQMATIFVFCCHVIGILHSNWLSGLLVNCVLEGCQLGLWGDVPILHTYPGKSYLVLLRIKNKWGRKEKSLQYIIEFIITKRNCMVCGWLDSCLVAGSDAFVLIYLILFSFSWRNDFRWRGALRQVERMEKWTRYQGMFTISSQQ